MPTTFCTETSDSEFLLNMLKVFIYTFSLHPTLSVYDLGINNSLVKKIKLLKALTCHLFLISFLFHPGVTLCCEKNAARLRQLFHFSLTWAPSHF